jgi:hypothetical protein
MIIKSNLKKRRNKKLTIQNGNFATFKYIKTITDTHTHLYSEEFDQDRDEMIQRALSKGISRFFIPAIDSSYTQAMYDLEKNYPEHVFLMMGCILPM